MSRNDAVTIASRMLSILLTLWALAEMSYLPEFVQSYLHYSKADPSSANVEYMQHYHVLRVGFLITRIVGLLLMARWVHKGGPEIQDLLLPAQAAEISPRV